MSDGMKITEQELWKHGIAAGAFVLFFSFSFAQISGRIRIMMRMTGADGKSECNHRAE